MAGTARPRSRPRRRPQPPRRHRRNPATPLRPLQSRVVQIWRRRPVDWPRMPAGPCAGSRAPLRRTRQSCERVNALCAPRRADLGAPFRLGCRRIMSGSADDQNSTRRSSPVQRQICLIRRLAEVRDPHRPRFSVARGNRPAVIASCVLPRSSPRWTAGPPDIGTMAAPSNAPGKGAAGATPLRHDAKSVGRTRGPVRQRTRR